MSDELAIDLGGKLGSFRLEVALRLPMHGISALFGPSGCGKTTILRSVAGLHRIPGTISAGRRVLQDATTFVPAHRRRVGYVFQEPSLFPHLTVKGNLEYAIHRASANAGAAPAFDAAAELLGLAPLLARAPETLSGGERQRVAIARALLSQPEILLMDEPLSALDREARDEILPYLETLHARLKVPILLVTHDLAEVERLADHLVVLRDGKSVLSGPLNEVLLDPRSGLAARRDLASILPARVEGYDPDGIATLVAAGCRILALADGLQKGDRVRIRIAATDVSLALERHPGSSILNAVPARILEIRPLNAAEVSVRLDLGQTAPAPVMAKITRRSLEALQLRDGQQVIAQIKSVSLLATR